MTEFTYDDLGRVIRTIQKGDATTAADDDVTLPTVDPDGSVTGAAVQSQLRLGCLSSS